MADHEAHQKRQRTNLGAARRPSEGGEPVEARPWNPKKLSPADIAEIQAAWRETHDLGLTMLRCPFRWRYAAEIVIRLFVIETQCGVCNLKCKQPENPECPLIRDKLP